MGDALDRIQATADLPSLGACRGRDLKKVADDRGERAHGMSKAIIEKPPSSRERRGMSKRDGDICFLPATKLARLYRARKVSPLEVMQAVLARIDAVNPVVNAYVTVAREPAMAAARTATRALGRKGTALPPLHGIPVSIKDLTATKGIRTTWGS